MTQATTDNTVLDTALDRLIDAAGGFDQRARRDQPVLLRFTVDELELIDRIAADQGIPRIDLLRRLLAGGMGNDHDLNEARLAIRTTVDQVKRAGIAGRLGAKLWANLQRLAVLALIAVILPACASTEKDTGPGYRVERGPHRGYTVTPEGRYGETRYVRPSPHVNPRVGGDLDTYGTGSDR